MAKAKTGVNKSEAIRQAFKELPGAKAKEIVAHLKAKGIVVAEGLVYAVKKTSKKKKPGRKPGKTMAVKANATSSNGHLSVGASIALVRSTAEKVGGFGALQEIVEALR